MSKLGIWVPHILIEKNKEDCIYFSRQRNEPFLKNIIAVDEKWVFYDNVQFKSLN